MSRGLSTILASSPPLLGTTDVASALSGYVRQDIAFAVLQNGHPVNWTAARKAQDRFVQALAVVG